VKRFENSGLPHRGILRDNVAALVLRKDGMVLWGECADKPGTWSFPQGGVDRGETRREALARELREEVGLPKSAYNIVASRSGYRYLYPEGRLKKGLYCGQMQTYFLCVMKGTGSQPHERKSARSPEFLRVAWVRPEELDLALVPDFKQDTIRAVIEDFFHVRLP